MINKSIQVICFLSLAVIFTVGNMPRNMDDSFIQFILIIDLVSLISFLFFRKENILSLKKQYIRIVYLFLLGFAIVHFQAYIDYLLGNLSSNNAFLWVDTAIVTKALVISSMGFVSYITGYSFNKNLVNIKTDSNRKYTNTKSLNIIATIILILFFFTVNKDYLNGQYGSADIGTTAQILAFIFEAAIYAIIIIECKNLIVARRSSITFIQYLIIHRYTVFLLFIYLGAVMFSGDRGPIIYCSLAFLFGYIFLTKKKIGLLKITFFLTLGLMFITLLGLLRHENKGLSLAERITGAVNNNVESYYSSSFLSGSKELALSVRTVHLSVKNVPLKYPHFYGLFFAQDVMLFIPMVKGFFIHLINIPKQYTSSAQFLTWVDLGAFATWGVGSSCIADTYLDFGFVGVIVVFFIFGYFTRHLELVAFSSVFPPPYLLIIVFCVFSFSIYISRSTICYSLSKFSYVWLFIYMPRILKRN
ncbi:MAG: O-antigen polymerase [Mucilaginibacter sp.]